MDVVRVHDLGEQAATDPRLADFVGLTDMNLRMRTEPELGLFVAEGELVVRRALATGHQPRAFLLTEHRLTTMAADLEGTAAPVYVADAATLQAVTGFHVHRGTLASFHRRELPTLSALLAGTRRLVILEDVNNHTNVGAIFRGAAGLGMDAVLLDPRTVDPLYRRSVRVSMGEVLQIPWTVAAGWPSVLDQVKQAGFRLLAMALSDDAVELPEVRPGPDEKIAVMLGTEHTGLSAAAVAAADQVVRIPMHGGVDSLNVAAAAAVVFYALGAGR